MILVLLKVSSCQKGVFPFLPSLVGCQALDFCKAHRNNFDFNNLVMRQCLGQGF